MANSQPKTESRNCQEAAGTHTGGCLRLSYVRSPCMTFAPGVAAAFQTCADELEAAIGEAGEEELTFTHNSELDRSYGR